MYISLNFIYNFTGKNGKEKKGHPLKNNRNYWIASYCLQLMKCYFYRLDHEVSSCLVIPLKKSYFQDKPRVCTPLWRNKVQAAGLWCKSSFLLFLWPPIDWAHKKGVMLFSRTPADMWKATNSLYFSQLRDMKSSPMPAGQTDLVCKSTTLKVFYHNKLFCEWKCSSSARPGRPAGKCVHSQPSISIFRDQKSPQTTEQRGKSELAFIYVFLLIAQRCMAS